ncbi:hypothetical protein [Galbibacter sp. BG1]
MKTIYKISLFLCFLGMLFTSCEDHEYEMGSKLDISNIDFKIEQDYNTDAGGNTVILTSNTPGIIPVWDYGTGKSNRAVDTINFAFAGDYEIKFSAMTDGGVVEAEPVTISVTEDNFNYVQDPLWIMLSGGVGNSKTWVLDLDENGVSKYFVGPQFFYGTDNGWLEDGEAWDGGDSGCYGEDCWNWSPDWPGNQWLMAAGDYGSMTFSLDGGPYVDVNHLMMPSLGEENGTYYLDANAHTLTLTNAEMLHNTENDACVDNWASIRIFSLTEDTMQLGVLRKDNCDGAAMLVFNFISKEYSDNWVPEETEPEIDEGYNPSFESGELLNMLTGGTGSGRVWTIDAAGNPIDWIAGGIGWTEDASSSYNWGWNDDWTAIAGNSWIRFDQWNGAQTYTRNQSGVETSGTFTIDETTNEITLDGETLIQNTSSSLNPTTNIIKVVKAYDDYETKGIWFGTSYDESKDEWLSFHYIIP